MGREARGVTAHAIYVRPMRRKWASCSTAGRVQLQRWLALDTKLGDYVIVHELLHFSVPNHGKLWKMLMRAHLGKWEPLHRQLEEEDQKRAVRRAGLEGILTEEESRRTYSDKLKALIVDRELPVAVRSIRDLQQFVGNEQLRE